MLFFFATTASQISTSPNRAGLFLFFLVCLCCTLPTICHAYPSSSASVAMHERSADVDGGHRRWTNTGEDASDSDPFLARRGRGTGYYIVRQGDYLVLVPDAKHHFSKNIRPYIGRRR